MICECLPVRRQPTALRKAIASACRKLQIRKHSERALIQQQLALRYYFGGKCVAYLPTPDGTRILAVGKPGGTAIHAALNALTDLTTADRARMIIEVPIPWNNAEARIESPFAVCDH